MQHLEIIKIIIFRIVNGIATFYNLTDEIFWKEMAPAMKQVRNANAATLFYMYS